MTWTAPGPTTPPDGPLVGEDRPILAEADFARYEQECRLADEAAAGQKNRSDFVRTK